ncbi:hypothetical protein [Hymenobacter arizonensis]|uniref:Uncharacterized protein n=1 Tax=Hymenobacter arizonensis TaxID=1227077 RepID=A0A1I5SE46_HYMAR|nr:hypothetical protein [Hymenobacter arizonensis]SFP68983.1 hypothetical protein SAMN04515668_0027 [Hymenobacter arizonensis]
MTPLFTWMRAVLLFYRGIAPFTLGISVLLLGVALLPLLHEGQAIGVLLPRLVLLKLLTGPVVWYLTERTRPHQYWFYYNYLGMGRRRLWAGVGVLDTLVFLALARAVTVLYS